MTNHLQNTSSPYLLQHAQNPVEWFPWGEEALQKARTEGKLILVSVGYAACHWCHVMAHNCFEDQEIADFMNAHFVNIKVDREERPDIDQIYMNAVMLINRQGGWPLNCFALPDGRPFFGGTYFPPERWLDLLKGIQQTYRQSPERIEEYARQVQQGIRQTERIFNKSEEKQLSNDIIKAYTADLKEEIDYKKGGTKGAPKFPMPSIWMFGLHYYFYYKDKELLHAVLATLNKMGDGGMYDHVGGGFARYSTDASWRVPHFEKMLYDNAQLLSLYAEAYKITEKISYKQILKETITFVKRELLSDYGGFYASLDADSDGEEGKFYVWQEEEIDEMLGADADIFKRYYSVNEKGAWEGTNILQKSSRATHVILDSGLSRVDFEQEMQRSLQKLLEKREERKRPATDSKILTSWNALTITGLIDAYKALQYPEYLELAEKAASFIQNNLWLDGQLYRNFSGKKAEIPAFLDDYALLTQAFLRLYQATFNEKWALSAEALIKEVLEKFDDPQSAMFFYTPAGQNDLIERKMELSDNVIPSSNAVMAENLTVAGKLFYKDDWQEKALQMMANIARFMKQNPAFYPAWATQYLRLLHPPYEVALTGKNLQQVLLKAGSKFLPNYVLAGKTTNESKIPMLNDKSLPDKGTLNIFPCQNKVCDLPLNTTEGLIDKLQE